MLTLTNLITITKIVKKTNAFMFKDIEVGDVLKLSVDVEKQGSRPSGGTYAPVIWVHNIHDDNSAWKTFNELAGILKCFEYRVSLEE